jgi:transcriptional regulator with XRE-family HTH domain
MGIDLNYQLIGKRLRAIRQKRGYTQEQISERAGISPQHCSGIECGSAKVSLPALVRLCNALEATPDEILMDSVKQTTPLFLKDVAEVFSDCSPDEIFLMLSQADNLKKSLRLKNIFPLENGKT